MLRGNGKTYDRRMLRIIVTGARNHPTPALIFRTLDTVAEGHTSVVLMHGACTWPAGHPRHGLLRGADAYADTHARRKGWEICQWPADWNTYGAAAGPIRNEQMVASGADICVAFPLPDSRGTKDCIRRALARSIPVFDASRGRFLTSTGG